MAEERDRGDGPGGATRVDTRPSEPQRRYFECGLAQSGGKLPLFDRDGR